MNYRLQSPAAPGVRSYNVEFTPDNGGTFSETQVVWFTLPAGQRGQFLDPGSVRLCMAVNNTGDNGISVKLDGTAASFISKLEVYSGSQILSSCTDWNALYSLLYDAQCPVGSRACLGRTMGVAAAATFGSPTEDYLEGGMIAQDGTFRVTLPLLDGLFSLNDHDIPLGNLSVDLRVAVTLESVANFNVRGVDNSISFTELSLKCVMRDLPDRVDQAVTQTGQSFHSKQYSNYLQTIAAASGSASVLIPCRVSSLSTVLCMFRPTANLNNSNRRSVASGRCTAGMTQFQFNCNGTLIPQKPVKTQSYEGAGEVQMHINTQDMLPFFLDAIGLYEGGNMHELGVGLGRIDLFAKQDTATDVYEDPDDVTSFSKENGTGTFGFACNLGCLDADTDAVINSGLNTLTSTLMLDMLFGEGPTTQSYRLNMFACYNVLYYIDDNGQLMVKK